MKQKLALMGALIHDPKLLILDEPFVGLDPVAAHAFKQQMRALCDRGGAVFFSTHVLDVAEKLCDKVAIIKNGRLAAFGDTDAVARRWLAGGTVSGAGGKMKKLSLLLRLDRYELLGINRRMHDPAAA